MKPSNPLEIIKALWGEWQKTSQPLRERATILPFGQYEDGSVGLAWPGLLESAWSGGRRVAETPIPAINDDEGWQRKAADSFDAAGLAMTGGLGLGLAGGMADNALGSAASASGMATRRLPASMAERNGFRFNEVQTNPDGVNIALIDRGGQPFGGLTYSISGDVAKIHNIDTVGGSNSLGVSGLKDLREVFRELYPDVKRFEGVRDANMKTGSAARAAGDAGYRHHRTQSINLAANAPTGAAVPLGMEGQDEEVDVTAILAELFRGRK